MRSINEFLKRGIFHYFILYFLFRLFSRCRKICIEFVHKFFVQLVDCDKRSSDHHFPYTITRVILPSTLGHRKKENNLKHLFEIGDVSVRAARIDVRLNLKMSVIISINL
jgi:hypothetical protein